MYNYLSTSISNLFSYILGAKIPIFIEDGSSVEGGSLDKVHLTSYSFLSISEILERSDVLSILSKHKDSHVLKIVVPSYYSSYLFCHIIFDILDILSNELFFVQTQIEFVFENNKEIFIDEFKDYIRKNIPFLQRNKVLPVYSKFLVDPSFHIDYVITLEQRFHILFIKEMEKCFMIQRIFFLIDL